MSSPRLLDAVDAVLFDIGSTLVAGPNLSPNRELQRRLGLEAEHGPALARLLMCHAFGSADDACDRMVAEGFPLGAADREFVRALWRDQEAAAVAIDGAVELFLGIRAAGKRTGLISDIWVPYFRSFAAACPEILGTKPHLFLSFERGLKKPDPRFFEVARAELGVAHGRVLVIGDTYENDVAPALALGMKAAWILSRAEREVDAVVDVLEGRRARPTLAVASTRRLVSALELGR